jgi:SAM-dependent methyltransferase
MSTVKTKIKNVILREAFAPGLLGLALNPFYFARKGLYKNMKELSPLISGKILDVGCGRKPYKNLFQYSKYVGIDIENPGHPHTDEDIDIYYDGKSFPINDDEFDNVICNQVLEHVFTPDELLKEINRVLKKDGYLLLTVPFLWDEHEQPNDYARYSSFGLKFLLEKNGFAVQQHLKSVSTMAVIFQMFNAYVHKKLMTKGRFLYYCTLFLIVFPTNVAGSIISAVLPKNDDLFLDNVVLAKKK